MSLTGSINSALSGIQINQTRLNLAANNIANAQNPNYSRKSLAVNVAYDSSGGVIGMHSAGVTRSVDRLLQNLVRSEESRAQYSSVTSEYAARLDRLFGTISDASSLPNTINNLNAALSSLVSNPQSHSARASVAGAARNTAARFNDLSEQIQTIRTEIEERLGRTTNRINALLTNISNIDKKIISAAAGGQEPAGLQDQQDQWVNELSGYLNIKAQRTNNGGVRIMTGSGLTLYDVMPAKLRFDQKGLITANSRYDTDPAKRGVGTITFLDPSGRNNNVDLLAAKQLRGGAIEALVNARDAMMVGAQDGLDALAGTVSRAFSTHIRNGTAVTTGGVTNGYDVGIANLREGDSVTFSYRGSGDSHVKRVTVYRSDGANPPALTNTRDANEIFLAVDFSSGSAATIAANIQAGIDADSRIGAGVIAVTASAGGDIRLQSADMSAGRVESASAQITATNISDYADALPLFTDLGGAPFTGMLSGRTNLTGYASRISFNNTVAVNPGVLVQYASDTPTGDTTRPNALTEKFSRASYSHLTGTGSGGVYRASIGSAASNLVSDQGERASAAAAEDAGRQVVANNLKNRLSSKTKVDTDVELGNLVVLQNAYQANAKVMQISRMLLSKLMEI